MPTLPLLVGLVSALAQGTGGRAAGRGKVGAPRASNSPPVVTTTLPSKPVFTTRDVVRFRITVTDPDGDHVNLKIVRGPDELTFLPMTNENSGATRDIVWFAVGGNAPELVLEAWDDVTPNNKVQFHFPMLVVGDSGWAPQWQALDLDQDGDLEFVTRALPFAQSGPFANGAGAFALFADPYPPKGSDWVGSGLTTSPQHPKAQLGYTIGSMQFADVTGDGVLDLIGVDLDQGGTVYVWKGPLTSHPSSAPDAVLHGNDLAKGYVSSNSHPVWIEDVTGDGVPDVVVAFPLASTAALEAGEVCVFAGGPGILGTPAPTATLLAPGAVAHDWLGHLKDDRQALWIGDVSGDGIPDVVVCADRADHHGIVNAGRIFVWAGGSSLSGRPAPLATLQRSSAAKYEALGRMNDYDFGNGLRTGTTEGIRLVDVTGDGVLDVVAGCTRAFAQPPPNYSPQGAIFVWKGGATLSGTLDPDATLRGGSTFQHALLGQLGWGAQGLQFADVNSDGITDVIAGTRYVNVNGQASAGAIFVWNGGALSGTVNPTAILTAASPKASDGLALYPDALQVVDVTGDGVPDVVAVSPYVYDTAYAQGAVRVWASNGGFSGVTTPTAFLHVPNAAAFDNLGSSDGSANTNPDYLEVGSLMVVADVTGDGVNDLVVGAPEADANSVFASGAVYVWNGGSRLASNATFAPDATLTDPAPLGGDELGFRNNEGPAIHVVDFDGDGVLDVATLNRWDGGYVYKPQPGEVLVWRGGSTLTGAAPAYAIATESLNTLTWYPRFGAYGWGLRFRSVTGSPYLDLVALDPSWQYAASGSGILGGSISTGAYGVGAVQVFRGGPTSQPNLAPEAILFDPFANSLQYGDGPFGVADLDHDGHDDVFFGSQFEDAGATSGAGEVFWCRGPIAQTTTLVHMNVPSLGAGAYVGY
jgi:hypothetical protein